MASAKRSTRFWLFKSEPDVYSIDDLARERRTSWEGVRNYQARNLMRDEMKKGDGVLFYHSNAKPMAVTGIGKIVKEAYPDHFAFDPDHRYFDPKSDPDDPAWLMLDVGYVAKCENVVTRDDLKAEPRLAEMMVLARGSRLSVQPVTAAEWKVVVEMGFPKGADRILAKFGGTTRSGARGTAAAQPDRQRGGQE